MMRNEMDKAIDNAVPIVLKPTGTVQISNKFTLIERRLLNTLVYFAQRDHLSAEEITLAVTDLMPLLGLENSKNYDIIKDALRILTGTIIEWNIFGEDKVQEWGVCTFLASGKIVRGKLKFRLNPEIVHQITHPRLFAKIQLLVQTYLHKRHALVLYEFVLDFVSRQKAQQLVIKDISLEKVLRLMGLDGTQYSEPGNYKIFNRDILKPSISEINQFSDICMDAQPVRANRRVVGLTFTVERKPPGAILPSLQALEDGENTEILPRELPGLDRPAGVDNNALVALLVSKGVGLNKARELITEHPAERILENIDLVIQRQSRNDKIRNPAAYVVKAIEEDFRLQKTDEQREAERQLMARQAAMTAAKDREALIKDWERFRIQRVEAYFAARSAAWQEQRRQQFVDTLAQNSRNDGGSLLYLTYRKHGFNSKLVQAGFLAELGKELLVLPEEKNFDDYLAWQTTR